MKVFAVIYAIVMAALIVAQVWLCIICLPFVIVALFTIPWSVFFAGGLLLSAFDTSRSST